MGRAEPQEEEGGARPTTGQGNGGERLGGDMAVLASSSEGGVDRLRAWSGHLKQSPPNNEIIRAKNDGLVQL